MATILRILGICAALYLMTVFIVARMLPLRVLSLGDAQCSSDWCIVVESAKHSPAGAEILYDVTLRIWTSAHHMQREQGLSLYLLDSRARRFDPQTSHVPLDVLLEPEQSVTATRTFKVPADANHLTLVVAREGGFPTRWFIIGRSPFDKTTVVRLD